MEEELIIEHQKRLVGYCRVSTDNQKEEGTVEIQRLALRESTPRRKDLTCALFSVTRGYPGGPGGPAGPL